MRMTAATEPIPTQTMNARPGRRYLAGMLVAGLAFTAAGCSKSSGSESSSPAPVATTAELPSGPLCDPLSAEPVVIDGQTLYCEQQQAGGGADILNGYGAPGEQPVQTVGRVELGEVVLVACLAEGPAEFASTAAKNPDKPGIAEWYKIVEPIEGYGASNSFLNVLDPSIAFEDQPTYDQRVPNC